MSMTNSGGNDVFVAAFNTSDFSPVYSVCLGGTSDDFGYGIAVDSSNNVYIVGQTLSTNFLTYNAPFTTRNGTNDAFLARIMWFVPPPVIVTQPASQTNSTGSSIAFSVGVDQSGTPPFSYQWQVAVTTNQVTVTNQMTVTNQVTVTNIVSGTNLVTLTNVVALTNVVTTTDVVTWTNLVNGGNISGATTNALIINPAQTTNSGSYSVIVTNYGGSATSSSATLSITNVSPLITVQPPTNQLVGVGTTAQIAVTAIGTALLSYQWMLGGTNLVNGTNLPPGGYNISGATSNVLTISNVQTNNAATNYSVIITNIKGSATSSNAALTVQISPVILTQPASVSNAVGATAIFSVNVVGMVPLSYHWRVNGTNLMPGGNISGATTNSSLVITNTQTTNSGNYYSVVITNRAGSTNSADALLTVTNIPPIITTQPLSQTNGGGTTAVLFVTATGTAPLRYQWQRSGTNLVNEPGHINSTTSDILIISNVQTNDSGNYTVVVTGPGSSTNSSVAVLTVQTTPLILVQPTPTNQTMAVGSTAFYAVTAIGTVPLSYHWRVNGTNLVNGNGISGATTNVLIITHNTRPTAPTFTRSSSRMLPDRRSAPTCS